MVSCHTLKAIYKDRPLRCIIHSSIFVNFCFIWNKATTGWTGVSCVTYSLFCEHLSNVWRRGRFSYHNQWHGQLFNIFHTLQNCDHDNCICTVIRDFTTKHVVASKEPITRNRNLIDFQMNVMKLQSCYRQWKLDESTARRQLKSPRSLSGRFLHLTLVTKWSRSYMTLKIQISRSWPKANP